MDTNGNEPGITIDTRSPSLENMKSIAKGLGHTALFIASPPIYGALTGRNKEEKLKRAGVGAIISYIIGIGGVLMSREMLESRLYDSPIVDVDLMPNHPLRAFAEALIFPAGVFLDNHLETIVTDGEDKHRVYGGDVISFDKETGRYVLDFDESRKFVDNNGRLVSLAGAQSLIEKLNDDSQEQMRTRMASIDNLVKNGNILEAREAEEGLDKFLGEYISRLASAESFYQNTLKEYGGIKKVYSDVVDTMNAELGNLRKIYSIGGWHAPNDNYLGGNNVTIELPSEGIEEKVR